MNRGEIYFVNLNPTTGREQGGRRPAVVVSIDTINRAPLVVTVVSGTSGRNVTQEYSTNARVSPEESGLPEETVFMCFQIRALDASRFPDTPAGQLSDSAMARLEDAMRYSLGL